MKRFYFAATLVFFVLSASFIGYGVYLNATSASYIETMLASRAVSLSGLRVSYRDLRPEVFMEYVDLKTRTQADAIAQIDGRLEELYVTPGQAVERGQPIGKLVNDEVPLSASRADTDVARAEASYLQALSVVERNKRLAAEDAVSASELESSISQMQASKAELDAAKIARRQIEQQSSFQIVTAPLSGSVLVVYQQPGNFVGKGAPVAMVADFSKLYFTTLIEDREFQNITPLDGKFSILFYIMKIGVMEKAFDSAPRAVFDRDTAFGVEILSVLPTLSEEATVRSVTCEVDNRLGVLETGMYDDVVIRKETPKRVLAIPLSVVFDQDGPRVYTRDADSRLAVRVIKTGAHDSEYIEVVEGLDEGDAVILSGVEGLEPGVKIDVHVEED
ncbi:MAG: efflux RND transporter periplasmic adaptor subunit [Synergistaceae bacterium]|nr:efflux RND transporter periplasmic adaptor subunit [Synergistaceae bacterium]